MVLNEYLVGCVTGDIHFLHPRVSNAKIINTIKNLFFKEVRKQKANLVVFNGDIYDRLVDEKNPDKLLVKSMFVEFFLEARVHDIAVRFLKGTPSHDHDQIKSLQAIANGIEGLDFKYVETVMVEHMERFGVNVLYVPDEWQHDCRDTFVDCLNELNKSNLKTVDYAFIHGQFDYQLGDVVEERLKHKTSDFEKIVTKRVFCNHIHTHSVHSIIVAPGSIERLAQSEEDDKGFIVFKNQENGCDCDFIINHNAVKHTTVTVSGMDMDSCCEAIDRKIKTAKLKLGDCLRVRCLPTDAIRHSEQQLQMRYSQIKITVETKDTKKSLKETIEQAPIQAAMIINKQTVPQLLKTQMQNDGVDAAVISHSLELLNTCLTTP